MILDRHQRSLELFEEKLIRRFIEMIQSLVRRSLHEIRHLFLATTPQRRLLLASEPYHSHTCRQIPLPNIVVLIHGELGALVIEGGLLFQVLLLWLCLAISVELGQFLILLFENIAEASEVSLVEVHLFDVVCMRLGIKQG